MEAVKTIDVKGLAHAEREKLIFPSIDGLKKGESIRLVVEFNPLPIVYKLYARDELEISYEKEGPEEWILQISRRAPQMDEKQRLQALLKHLASGQPQE